MAHAECRLFNVATKVMAVELEHARLTDRLRGDALPGLRLGAETPPKPMAVASPRKKSKVA